MATVYLARDVKHDRNVAIKVLDPEIGAALGGDRFLLEIKTTANFRHPHIVPLFDSREVHLAPGTDGERSETLLYYVMMPLVEASPCGRQWIARPSSRSKRHFASPARSRMH